MLTQISVGHSAGQNDLVGMLSACHERIRRFVRLAHQAATRWDVPIDQVTQACDDVERYFREALPLHVADEEQSIEPRLRGISPPVDEALAAMAAQHRGHDAKVEALLRSTGDVRSDPQSKPARTALEEAATNLEHDFAEHLALEERVIFPAIREHLSPEAQAAIIAELRQRRKVAHPS